MIKCALCGCYWEKYGELGGAMHPETGRCPFDGLPVYRPILEAINAAIEAARVDKRRPEKCIRHPLCDCEIQYSDAGEGEPLGMTRGVCPCAAWEEK